MFDVYGDSRENLLEVLVVVIILSLMSFVHVVSLIPTISTYINMPQELVLLESTDMTHVLIPERPTTYINMTYVFHRHIHQHDLCVSFR